MEKDLKSILGKLQYTDDAKVVQQITQQTRQVQDRMSGIKHKIVVMSGKGGVGKSMTTVNLALALGRQGYRVGIIDVDLNGPCVPRMMGILGKGLEVTPDGARPPEGPYGIKVASMDFLLNETAPVRWKGPMDLSPVWLGLMEMNVIREFFADILWGDLDYLLADLPPGCRSGQAAGHRRIPAGFGRCGSGHDAIGSGLERGAEVDRLCHGTGGLPCLGVVENMGQYRCPSCGVENELFEGNTEGMCEALNLPLLGRIPFDRNFAKTFDKGTPLLDGEYPTNRRYTDIVGRIQSMLDYKRVLAENL